MLSDDPATSANELTVSNGLVDLGRLRNFAADPEVINGSILLEGVTLGDLTVDDFILGK